MPKNIDTSVLKLYNIIKVVIERFDFKTRTNYWERNWIVLKKE